MVILLVAAALAAATAQQHASHVHDHGHAYSSQSFVLHQSHDHTSSHHEELHSHHEEGHGRLEASHHGHHDQYFGHHEAQHAHHEISQHSHQEVSHHGHNEEHHGQASSSQNIQLHHGGHVTKHVEYYAHPKYEFAYEVKDPHTHDHKYQHEARDGDSVKGVYSLDQPDGTVRIVKYHADKKIGFNADVRYEGHAQHIVPEHHHHHH